MPTITPLLTQTGFIHRLEFVVHLTDEALVAVLQKQDFGSTPGYRFMAPTVAATFYDCLFIPTGSPLTPGANVITSSWFTAGDNFPIDEEEFVRKVGGWFGIGALFGKKHTYQWVCHFEYNPPLAGPGESVPGTPDPIARRRWIEGFETIIDGTVLVSRTASRSTQGLGLALREWGNSGGVLHQPMEFQAGFTPSTSWERFYIRPHVFPTAQHVFWRLKITGFASVGLVLAITPGGQLALFSVNSASALSLLGTAAGTLALDEWIRIDILYKIGTGAAVYLFINGQAQLTITGIAGEFATPGSTHSQSEINDTITSGGTGSLDVDDWMCADWPASAPAMTTPGPDWLSGTRVALVRPTGFDTTNVWTGDWKLLTQSPPQNAVTGYSLLTSSVSGAKLSVTTDYDLEVRGDPNGQIGVAAVKVGLCGYRAGALSGQLGYTIAGGAEVLAAVTQGTTPTWAYVMYRPSGLTVGQDIFPLTLVHTKAADATACAAMAMAAEVEVLGIFGPEDVPVHSASFSDLAYTGATPNIHNAPYPHTPWATATIPPVAPIAIYAGTYTGNAAGVEISFKTPIHWWWVRNVTTLNAGTHWFSGMTSSHRGFEDQNFPELMTQALQDPTFTPVPGEDGQETSYLIRIAGGHSNANLAGQTYAYTAISDPGGRFLLTGGLKHCRGTATVDTTLPFTNWLPECAFVQREFGSARMFYKGPGHAAASLSGLEAAETANALTFGTSHLIAQSAMHASTNNIAYAVLRREDGNVRDPDSTDPYSEVFQIANYTGDGTASRTVGLSPPSGKRPVFAVVVPHNTASVYRDHAHTGTTSTTIAASNNPTTGITGGGIDTISVGSSLNSNGIVYDVFVLPGSATAGNGGFSVPGEFFPRPPATPPGPGTPPTPGQPTPPGPGPTPPTPPGPGPGGPSPFPPFPTSCVAASTQIVNMALSKVGLSKFVVDVNLDQTVEATMARLHYADVVDQVLGAIPWPIATACEALTRVSTYYPTFEWQYAYRVPEQCVFPRRLVQTARQMAVDPTPPPFQLTVDDVGALLLTNDTTALLEYTFRPVCAAALPDPLFREALIWKLASALAIPLSRMKDQAVLAEEMYARTLQTARAIIPPGLPGMPVAAPTIDIAPASQAANVEAVNLALVRIGARTIRNLTDDQSREAQAARIVFEKELRETLRAFPWPFATGYADVLLVVGGTLTQRYNPDWQYAYRLPNDCVFARRMMTAAGRTYLTQPPEFRLGSDPVGGLIFCNEIDPGLEYTRRPDGVVAAADSLFVDAFAWRLAATLAPSLASVDPARPEQEGRGPTDPAVPKERAVTGVQMRQRIAANAWQMFDLAIVRAKVAAGNESQPTIERPDAPWIEGRN